MIFVLMDVSRDEILGRRDLILLSIVILFVLVQH